MAFESFSEFIQMGRHGLYVWSAYGFSSLALVGITLHTWRVRSSTARQLLKRYQREQQN